MPLVHREAYEAGKAPSSASLSITPLISDFYKPYLKIGFLYFLVIPGLNRNPVTFPFII